MDSSKVLRCGLCGREQDEGERGWRGLLGQEEDDSGLMVGVFCPECAARELGPTR